MIADLFNADGYPLTLSKSELLPIFRASSFRTVRRHYITDDVVREVLQMDVVEFKRIRVFDAMQTRRLIEWFRLSPEHFKN